MSWANKISCNAAASNETAFMFVQTYNSTLFSKYLPIELHIRQLIMRKITNILNMKTADFISGNKIPEAVDKCIVK